METFVTILALTYLCLVVLSFLYSKRDFGHVKTNFFVVLSGDYNMDTRQRCLKAIQLANGRENITLVCCGKAKAKFMRNIVSKSNFRGRLKIQRKSTNTEQDAIFINKFLTKNTKHIVLITSSLHQRRSYHTFKRIYPNLIITNKPTLDWFNLYSPLLPLAWYGMFLNMYKDYKYNHVLW